MDVREEIDWLEKLTYKDDIELAYNPKLNKITGLYVLNEDSDNVSLDSLIAKLIVTLNKIDFVQTTKCCSGHEDNYGSYISFKYNKETLDFVTGLARQYFYIGIGLLGLTRKIMSKAIKLTINPNDISECYNEDNDSDDLTITLHFNTTHISRKERDALYQIIINDINQDYNLDNIN